MSNAHPIFDEALKAMSERDDDRAEIYDRSYLEDERYDAMVQEQMDEREQRLEEALNECLRLGVNREHLKVLAFETGATSWALRQSLRVEQKREKTWFKD